MHNDNQLQQLSLPQILQRNDLEVEELLTIKDIHNNIKRNLKIFADYCKKHHPFTEKLITLGLKCPTHESSNLNIKNITYIAADILTSDHQSLGDLFILSGKRLSKEDQQIIGGEQIEEEIQTEICQQQSQEEPEKYKFLFCIFDYVNSEQLDENCLNYITKALNILIRRKLAEFLEFFHQNSHILKRLVDISYYPSIAHFLAKLLTDDEDNLSIEAQQVKMKIIPLVLDKIHQDIFKPEIAQVLEFLEDVLNSSRYGDFQERSQLQKISDIIVSSKELNFYVVDYISALNKQTIQKQLFHRALNSASFLAVVVNRMNMDEQQDFNFSQVVEFKPTLIYEVDDLYANFCKLILAFKKVWAFKAKFQSQFWYAANKIIEPLILMTKHSRFRLFYSKIPAQDRLQALKTLIHTTCEIDIHGIILQNVTNLLQKILGEQQKLAQSQNFIVAPSDLYAIISQNASSLSIYVESLIQETTIKRNKNENGIYYRKILLLIQNYFKNTAVLQRYPTIGSLQSLFPSFNKQNCKLFAQKAAILNHPDGKKVKQVSQFQFLHKNNNIVRQNSPQPEEQVKPREESQLQKKPVQIVFKLEGKLKALKQRVKQKQTDKGQNIQIDQKNQETLNQAPPKMTQTSLNSPTNEQQNSTKICNQKQQKTGLTFFVRHLLIY